ncbi:hypothetical protein BRO13_04975, partial [Xanthomonas oryzae pv. oryzae]
WSTDGPIQSGSAIACSMVSGAADCACAAAASSRRVNGNNLGIGHGGTQRTARKPSSSPPQRAWATGHAYVAMCSAGDNQQLAISGHDHTQRCARRAVQASAARGTSEVRCDSEKMNSSTLLGWRSHACACRAGTSADASGEISQDSGKRSRAETSHDSHHTHSEPVHRSGTSEQRVALRANLGFRLIAAVAHAANQ